MADEEPPTKRKRVSFAPSTTFASSDEGSDSEPENAHKPPEAEDDETSTYAFLNIPPPGLVAAAQYSASGPNSTLPSRVGSPSPSLTATTSTTSITTTGAPQRRYPAGVEVEVPSSPPQSSDQPTPVLASPQARSTFFPDEMPVFSPDAAAVKLPSSPELQVAGSRKRRHEEMDYASSSSSSSSDDDDEVRDEESKAGKQTRIIKRAARSSGLSLSLGTPRKGILKTPTKFPSEERSSLTAEEADMVALIKERMNAPVDDAGRQGWDVDMGDADNEAEDSEAEDSEAEDADAEDGGSGLQRAGGGSEGGDTGSEYEGESGSESEEE